jgi:hypothetical protein
MPGAAAGFGEPVLADRPGGHGGLLVDDQVRVGSAWPPVVAVLQPGQQQGPRQVVERAGRGRDDEPHVADAHVAEVQFPDDPGPGGVPGGQRDRKAGGGRDGGGSGCVDSAVCSGWMRISGRWPPRTPRVGSAKILPVSFGGRTASAVRSGSAGAGSRTVARQPQ